MMNMNHISRMRQLSIVLCLATFCISAYGRPIDRLKAKQIAQQFLKSECRSVDMQSSSQSPLKTLGQKGTPEFYVFNKCDSAGFVIVSGDDNTPSILGFGLTGAFDSKNIPDNLGAHLENLRHQISLTRNDFNNPVFDCAGPQSEKGMRLLTPDWNQSGFPFAAMIPGNTHAGCVPAAMSIIMGAWHWPVRGEGSSYHSGTVYLGNQSIDYDITLNHDVMFDLDNVSFKYTYGQTSPEDEDILARLLYHTSVSVKGKYDPVGSGATVANARDALIDHFKFTPGMNLNYGQSYKQIEEILRSELAAGRPVIYSADSDVSGHAFVCDGVWDNYFHFNLGWGGSGNGYYLLNAIKPDNRSEGYIYSPYVLYPIKPLETDSDYSPRSIPVVYDILPTEPDDPGVVSSPDYSPLEFTNENGGVGLASPRDSYPKGKRSNIYVSGLKLTGRFSGTVDIINDMVSDYDSFNLAIGVVSADNKVRALYPQTYPQTIYRSFTWSNCTLYSITPDIDILPTDRLCLYAKRENETEWKLVKGGEGTTSELSCSTPSSEYLPFSVEVNTTYFRTANIVGQLVGKIVKGQSYALYLYPLQPMESIDVTINGKTYEFSELKNDDGSLYAYYVTCRYIDEQGLKLSAKPLFASETDVQINLPSAGQLETMVNGRAPKIRHLTISGDMNIYDLRYLSKANFPLLQTLNMSNATITPYLSIYKADELPAMFMYNHTHIENIFLPNALRNTGESALSYCSKLTKLSIPASLQDINKYSLSNCPLGEVTNYSHEPQDIDESFVSNLADNSVLIVPQGCKTYYEQHPLWNKFSEIIEKDLVGIDDISDKLPTKVVYLHNNSLVTEGFDSESIATIYTLVGNQLWHGKCADIKTFEIDTPQPIIVVIDGKSFKLL